MLIEENKYQQREKSQATTESPIKRQISANKSVPPKRRPKLDINSDKSEISSNRRRSPTHLTNNKFLREGFKKEFRQILIDCIYNNKDYEHVFSP